MGVGWLEGGREGEKRVICLYACVSVCVSVPAYALTANMLCVIG